MWNIWHVPHSGTCQYIYNTIFCVVYSTIQYLLYTIQYFALFNSFAENYPTHYFSFNMIFCETLFRNSPRSSIELVIFLFVWTCNSLNVTYPVTPEDKTIQLKAMRLKISHLWHVAHLFFLFPDPETKPLSIEWLVMLNHETFKALHKPAKLDLTIREAHSISSELSSLPNATAQSLSKNQWRSGHRGEMKWFATCWWNEKPQRESVQSSRFHLNSSVY